MRPVQVIEAEMSTNHQRRAQAKREVQQNKDLTPQARDRRVREIDHEWRREAAVLEDERRDALEVERADLHRRAFGIGRGDDSAALNARDARREALSTPTSGGALASLVDTAAGDGDAVMVKAGARVALERGDVGALKRAAKHDHDVADVVKFEATRGTLKSKLQMIADSIRGGEA